MKKKFDEEYDTYRNFSGVIHKISGIKFCIFCGKHNLNMKTCSSCKLAYYCNKECQIKDWKIHKLEC